MIIPVQSYIRGTVEDRGLWPRKKGNPGKKKQICYTNCITAFDIETTRLDGTVDSKFAHLVTKKTRYGEKLVDDGKNEESIMYIWQFHIYGYGTIVGRTWSDFLEFIQQIGAESESIGGTTVVWVHNLSYEFQWLQGLRFLDPSFTFATDDVFAVDSRKVLTATVGNIEFRDAYLHSNMGLAKYLQFMGVNHQKLSGDDYDYDKKRFPWSKLTERELMYCNNDVEGLCEAIWQEMQNDGDDIYTIPRTSTGYVRRDCREAMNGPREKSIVKASFPDETVFKLLHDAYRGGNTHASRHYSGRILDTVYSKDECSAYPFVLCAMKYPCGKWTKFNGNLSWTDLDKIVHRWNKAVVVRLAVSGLELKNKYNPMPYISAANVEYLQYTHPDTILDNGRILSCPYCEMTVTDIDLAIIMDQYRFTNCKIMCGAYADYKQLPDPLVRVIQSYFAAKTELKGVKGQEYFYAKSKNKVNATYGMTATNPAKQLMEYVQGAWVESTESISDLLEKSRKHAFLSYAWGVWCTAHARRMLQEGIDLIENTPGAHIIYCDTDSTKYIGQVDFGPINKYRMELAKRTGSYATAPDGTVYYMGVFESEDTYSRFATLGAKKYAFEYPDGFHGITIAGVSKKEGAEELWAGDSRGCGLERFVDIGTLDDPHGFVFRAGGGLQAIYKDYEYLKYAEIDGHKIPIISNVVLRPSEYTLGLAAEYEKLITSGELPFVDWMVDRNE